MQKAKKVGLGQNNAKSKLFYFALFAIPTIQFLIFWVLVNFNSILMAFKEFHSDATTINDFDWGFKNFTHWFTDNPNWTIHKGGSKPKYNNTDLFPALWITIKSYGISLVTSLPLGLFFSYYMFKRMPGAGIFRVLLFMPSIISAAPISLIFRYLMQTVVGMSGVVGDGWFDINFFKGDYMYGTMMSFSIFIAFGTSVLMYTNKMDSIAPEIIESAHLDGANGFKEFWYIVLPQTFSIVQVFLITGFAGAFTSQHNAFTLFSTTHLRNDGDKVTSIGFLLWYGVKQGGNSMWALAPYAALGLIVTVVVVPLTFLFRHLINKFGWKEE